MVKILKPNKEKVRLWLMDRRSERRPLPDYEQIRNQLGWKVAREHIR